MNAHNKQAKAGLDRRSFLIGTGAAGLIMGFIDPLKIAGGVSEAMAANSFAPSPWYMLTADGGMTVYVAKAEMGQHVGTALAQIIAEELELDWRKVKL